MVSILLFPGTNCEFDMEYAYQKILGIKTRMVWHKNTSIPNETRLVVIPGGFSYGDYLRSGAIAHLAPIMKAVKNFALAGGRVLGICNGFQILTESRMLPGALKHNKNLHFISKDQDLIIENTDNALLASYEKNKHINLPIAHADGSYYIQAEQLKTLESNHQILMRYADDVNGSIGHIAGVCNAQRNVFGLMPHPERAIEKIIGGEGGLKMLESLYRMES